MQQRGSKYFARRPPPPPPPPPTPPTLWMGSVGKKSVFFQYMVMLLIKLKRITNAATW